MIPPSPSKPSTKPITWHIVTAMVLHCVLAFLTYLCVCLWLKLWSELVCRYQRCLHQVLPLQLGYLPTCLFSCLPLYMCVTHMTSDMVHTFASLCLLMTMSSSSRVGPRGLTEGCSGWCSTRACETLKGWWDIYRNLDKATGQSNYETGSSSYSIPHVFQKLFFQICRNMSLRVYYENHE